MKALQVSVEGRSIIDVTMEEDVGNLDEVVVVAFGTQKKASVVSAITTVTPADLKVPSSNLTTALAGRVDRKSVVSGKSVSVRVDLGGRGIIKKKINKSDKGKQINRKK